MKEKIFFKIILILILLISSFVINCQNIYATSISDAIEGADEFIKTGVEDTNATIDENNLKTMSDMLYNAFLIVGIIIAVIIGLFIAMKFMTGSVEQKAEVKKTLIPYIAGCIVIFGAFTIWKLVVDLFSNV